MGKIIELLRNNIGFSWKGLIIFLLPMLPNALFFIFKDQNGNMSAANNHFLLDIVEHGSQVIFAALLIFMVSRKDSPVLCGYTILMLILVLAYYGLWIGYFTIGADFIMLMAMAVLPVIYFILGEIWLHNIPAVIATALFGIVHIIITYMDYH